MSELKQYLDKVSWTESVSQHKKAIIFIHDRQIKDLERQLDEAIKIAENAIKNWGDTAYSYGSYSDDIDTEEIKLKQLKEKGE